MKPADLVSRLLGEDDGFEAWVRELIRSYEELASDVWTKYDIDEVEAKIGKQALESLLNYDLDDTPDGGEPNDQIVQQALEFHNKLGGPPEGADLADHSETMGDEWSHNSPQEVQLEAILNEVGIKSSYEHPGYINVPCKLGSLNIGTVDGWWGADISDGDGGNVDLPDELQDAFGQFKDKDPYSVTPDNLINATRRVLAWANS